MADAQGQDQALDFLRKIAADGERTRKAMEALALHLGAGARPAAQSGASAQQGAPRIASDADLVGEYGDKTIKKDPPAKGPRPWTGASYIGRRWSETEPAYLDALAGFFDWTAGKKREEAAAATDDAAHLQALKYAGYDEADAAKVRAWAKRLREQEASL